MSVWMCGWWIEWHTKTCTNTEYIRMIQHMHAHAHTHTHTHNTHADTHTHTTHRTLFGIRMFIAREPLSVSLALSVCVQVTFDSDPRQQFLNLLGYNHEELEQKVCTQNFTCSTSTLLPCLQLPASEAACAASVYLPHSWWSLLAPPPSPPSHLAGWT